MVLLRELILGPERFDWAFRKYIRDWAYRHPSPSDFFREMQNEGGEDLSWFWRGWYMENWKYDVAVDKIDGNTVTLSNRGQLVLPTTVEATFQDGTKARILLPVETWMAKGTYYVDAGEQIAHCNGGRGSGSHPAGRRSQQQRGQSGVNG